MMEQQNSCRVDFRPYEDSLIKHAQTWTQSEVFAREFSDGIAIYSSHGNRTFKTLNDNANRLANTLIARGLKAGDAIALMCRNRAEFIEVFLAAMRIGLRLTPINTHLTWGEAAYIVENCQAKVFFAERALFDVADNAALAANHLSVAIINIGEDEYLNLLTSSSPVLASPCQIGSLMLYTSGTTGKPKGVYRETPEPILPQYAGSFANYDTTRDVGLCCGPAYHSAPLLFDLRWPLASGIPIVLVDKWDSVGILTTIETYKVTHTHMVATMFQRLLALPEKTRLAKDISSLRFLVHGAAPCPILVKRAMIDWLGPILIEYYGATEGGDGIHVDSQQWLKKPGTVGRMDVSLGHTILDDAFQEVPIGTVGRIYFKAPDVGRFAYFGDADKTASAYAGDRFTLGDMGYLDSERYLFLTGRMAECIISGGVNIYPQEVDDVLLTHPAVRDVCTVGIPDNEWGEQVVSLVVTVAGVAANDELALNIMTYAAKQLASFKRPRQIYFEDELPRSASGKLLRQQVRQRFWLSQARSI
jgi:long-chain acyl-CoA synthetase